MGDAGLDKYTETGNMCYPGEVKTPFATAEDIDSMKAMLANAKPGRVIEVADAWKNIHEELVGGSGSVKADFDKAVEHVLQHWEGESADEFAKKARKISKQISDCAKYADYTSIAMRNAGERLSDIKPKVDAIEKPSKLSSAVNALGDGFSRDDTKWKGEIQGNQGAQKALDNHDDDLSAGKEEQLKAAALMESLALTYTSQTKTMGTWEKKKYDGTGDYPGEPGGVAPVPIAAASAGGAAAAVAGAGKTGAGALKNASKATSPKAVGKGTATKVDGISGGTATTPRPGGANAGGLPNSGGTVSGGNAGAGATGGVPGGPGLVGQASGSRGAPGRGGAGRGVAGRLPAGLGAGKSGGAAGKGAGGAAGRGPLARQRGGTLDTPEQNKGPARQGGQGLHSSRGGTMAGERGRGTNGLMGRGVAGNNSRRNQSENSQGERPDYLVEDEETWMPQRRDVAPPTIG